MPEKTPEQILVDYRVAHDLATKPDLRVLDAEMELLWQMAHGRIVDKDLIDVFAPRVG